MFRLLLRSFCNTAPPKDPKPRLKPKLSSKPSNTPRPPKDPPDEGYSPGEVTHVEIEVAEFVRPSAYRQFSEPNERLGPGAGAAQAYKNSHYFGYHRFSYNELQNQSLELRDEQRLSGGIAVQTETDAQKTDELDDDCLEAMQQREQENDEKLADQAKEKELSKLTAWCKQIEKKQEQMAELQVANTLGDEELKAWCQEREKKKKQQETDKKDKKDMEQSVESRITEILAECTGKLQKVVKLVASQKGAEQDDAVAQCEEMVMSATAKAIAKKRAKEREKEKLKCEEAKKKEEANKKGAQQKAEQKDDKKEGKCEKKDEKKEDRCEKKDEKKADKCEKKDEKKTDKCEKKDEKKAGECEKKDEKKTEK
ncbi:hypothetical protein KR222_000092 [Zaprionus bogoriensis]|nr:hypothetical protein KR222_000092 [Zaprionus bogoriensis]